MQNRTVTYRRLFAYLGPHKKEFVLAVLGMLGAVVFNLFIPQLVSTAIDSAVAEGRIEALVRTAGLLLLVGCGRGASMYAQLYYQEYLTHSVAYELRNEFYWSVQKLPFSFHDVTHTGDLMSRATADISETQRFIGIGLIELSRIFLLLTGVLIAMSLESLFLTALAMGPMLILLVIAILFGRKVRGIFKAIQEQLAVISTTMQETLTGIQLVKVFSRENYERDRFDEENAVWVKRRIEMIVTWSNNWPVMGFLVALAIMLILWYGGPMVIEEQLTLGTLFAMISYLLLLNGPVQRVGFLVNLAATAVSAAERIFEIVDTDGDILESPNAIKKESVIGEIEFENVSFSYQGGPKIIRDVSLTASPGETVALIGPTGSGKSTLTNLIPRFYDATEGVIRLDGDNIKDLTLKSLRSEIGMVLQDSFLFSDTIAENIAYGDINASMDDLADAARAARAHEFIENLPLKYQTIVGERGVTLSGGQKQRIAIARALLADPRILILDDSTSSVDTETEYLIQQALNELMVGRTTFVIAQRLLTLKNADQILVLDDGAIVERGKHDDLLMQDGLYRHLYDLQLKDQEELKSMGGN
ncbi:MAG: ABC transporter ATP-binding protein [Anaerolineae bacterium]